MKNATEANEASASEGRCSKPGRPFAEEAVIRYEQLRRQAIDGSGNGCCPGERGQGLGWALLLRRGMAAWLQAWPTSASRAGTERLAPAQCMAMALPKLDAEITMVLTNMAAHHFPSRAQL